jgi:hypothetical protein
MKYTKEQIEEMKDIMLSYLTTGISDVGFAVVNFEDKEEGITPETAYMEYLGHHQGMKFFDISYDAVLAEYPNEFKRMLAHELVHVMQVLRGDKFDYSVPYAEQLHEVEAYNREDEVVDQYEKVMKFRAMRKRLQL